MNLKLSLGINRLVFIVIIAVWNNFWGQSVTSTCKCHLTGKASGAHWLSSSKEKWRLLHRGSGADSQQPESPGLPFPGEDPSASWVWQQGVLSFFGAEIAAPSSSVCYSAVIGSENTKRPPGPDVHQHSDHTATQINACKPLTFYALVTPHR